MTEEALTFETSRTAILFVDIQNFTVDLPLAPYSGQQVLANAVRLADAARARGITVILIRVGHPDNAVPQLSLIVDAGFATAGGYSNNRDLPPALGPKAGDIVIDKTSWGAFAGTGLDAVLRRRGVDTLILTGITSHIAIDTTMREANALAYHQVVASDATAAFKQAEHDYVMRTIAPRLARVRTTDQILEALTT